MTHFVPLWLSNNDSKDPKTKKKYTVWHKNDLIDGKVTLIEKGCKTGFFLLYNEKE